VTTCNHYVSFKHVPDADPFKQLEDGDPDPENDEKLFAYGTDSSYAQDEAAEHGDNDRTNVIHNIPPPPVPVQIHARSSHDT